VSGLDENRRELRLLDPSLAHSFTRPDSSSRRSTGMIRGHENGSLDALDATVIWQ
jgi:hypothetical protein